MNNSSHKIFNNIFFVTVCALLCCLLWGSSTPFIKMGYEFLLPERNTASTILFAGIRFTLAGVLTILIYSIARGKLLYPKKENIGRVLKLSSFQTVIQYVFFYIGLANTSGVKGTVISGSSTFFAILIASLIFRQEKLTLRKIIACILGFSGIVVVNLTGIELTMNFFGDGFVIFSAIAYGMSSVLIKRYSEYEDPVTLSGYQFMIGGIFMVAVSLLTGGKVVFSSFKGIAVITYLASLSAVAYSLWGVLLKYNSVSKISIFSFTIPVFGVLLSSLLLSETSNVSPGNLIITLILVCAGIIILNYTPKHTINKKQASR